MSKRESWQIKEDNILKLRTLGNEMEKQKSVRTKSPNTYALPGKREVSPRVLKNVKKDIFDVLHHLS